MQWTKQFGYSKACQFKWIKFCSLSPKTGNAQLSPPALAKALLCCFCFGGSVGPGWNLRRQKPPVIRIRGKNMNSVQNLCWLMIKQVYRGVILPYITQYLGDYHHPQVGNPHWPTFSLVIPRPKLGPRWPVRLLWNPVRVSGCLGQWCEGNN